MTEDLTTYTLVPNGSLSVTASKVTGGFYQDQDKMLYKNFGADYFDAINLNFEGYIADTDPYGYDAYMYAGFSNVVDDMSGWGSATDIRVCFLRSGGYGEGNYYITLSNGPPYTYYDYCIISPGVNYYLTLTRVADSATLKIYTDADRTTLFYTLVINGLGTAKWRYFYAGVNYYTGESTHYVSGYYQNYEFLSRAAGQVRFIGMMM